MKSLIATALLGLSALTPLNASGQEPVNGLHLSLKLESQETIKKGNKFLLTKQHADGYWGEPTLPAISAYVLRSLCLLYTSPSPRDRG